MYNDSTFILGSSSVSKKTPFCKVVMRSSVIKKIVSSISHILLAIIDVILIFTIVILFYFNQTLYSSKVVYIPNGSISYIVSYLKDLNFDISNIDRYFIIFFGKPQSGWIDISQREIKRANFYYKLTHQKAATRKITLIPGETKEIFFKHISDEFGLDEELLTEYYDKKCKIRDGVLIPQSYQVPMGMSERHLIYYLINYSLRVHKERAIKIFGHYDKKRWFRYITIASIIQKEAANKKEMPLISSVIHNRLKLGMKLQMDGALNYGKNSHKKVTKKMIREDSSIFNTYKRKGLPPYPVCSASVAAIKAAIFPAKTKYLYFVK